MAKGVRMNFQKIIAISIVIFVTGCAHSGWRSGTMYSFHEVTQTSDDTWFLKLALGITHDDDDVEFLLNEKAIELCKDRNFEFSDPQNSSKYTHTGIIGMNVPIVSINLRCISS